MKSKLSIATGLYIALFVVGSVVAISRKLPAEFGHRLFSVGDADQVARDWWAGSGTALSGPATMLVIVAAAAFLLSRTRPAYTVGVVVLTIVGFLTPVFSLGEPITWEAVASGTFDVLVAAQAWGITATAMFMWAFGVAEILRLRQEKGDLENVQEPTRRAGDATSYSRQSG